MRCTIFLELSSAVYSEDGSPTDLAASRPCLSHLYGLLSVLRYSVLHKTRNGCSAVSLPPFRRLDEHWQDAARVFTGLGTGMLNAVTPVWATETASHTSRGAFVSLEFTLNIFGVVVAYWIELCAYSLQPFRSFANCFRSGTSKYFDQESSFIWRFPIAFQIVPLTFLAVIVWFMPESPVWKSLSPNTWMNWQSPEMVDQGRPRGTSTLHPWPAQRWDRRRQRARRSWVPGHPQHRQTRVRYLVPKLLLRYVLRHQVWQAPYRPSCPACRLAADPTGVDWYRRYHNLWPWDLQYRWYRPQRTPLGHWS